jgi:hypothetical protein
MMTMTDGMRPWFMAAPVLLVTLAAAAQPADPTSVVRAAVQVLKTERQGVIAFHHVYNFQEHGPGHNKTEVNESLRLSNDGQLVAVRILREVSNGNVADAQALAKLQSDADKNPPTDDYRLPLSDEALQEYRFQVPATPCADCPAGSTAIQFTSVKRDTDHADGTIVIDNASHHVLQLDFQPSVLPAHTDTGVISIRFGRVLPDLWDIVQTHEHYTGHMLFIHGWGDVVETDGEYRRFKTLDEGRQALAQASPAPSP